MNTKDRIVQILIEQCIETGHGMDRGDIQIHTIHIDYQEVDEAIDDLWSDGVIEVHQIHQFQPTVQTWVNYIKEHTHV